jgi:hypothetical protein
MKEDHTLKPVVIEDGPTTSEYVFGFLVPIPRKLNGRLAIALRGPPIYFAPNHTKLKLTHVLGSELNERLDFFVQILVPPLGHRDDVPAAFDGWP